MWYGIVDDASGNLLSITSERPEPQTGRSVVEWASYPDQMVQVWSAAQRAWMDRPPLVFADRVDDIERRFMNDADFMFVWNNLTQARRDRLRLGLRRVLASFLGGYRTRTTDEPEEL